MSLRLIARPRAARLAAACLFLLLAGPAPPAARATPPAAPDAAAPARLAGRAFGQAAEALVAGTGEPAETALRDALRELAEVERLVDPAGSLAAIEAAAGGPPQPADPRLIELLARAAGFCSWSEGIVGPLGGKIYRPAPSGGPAPDLASAGCDRLALDRRQGTVRLAAGSAFDLRDFAAGYAVDRAVEALEGRGVQSGFVRVGAVQRGFGPGPGGRGWRAVPAPTLERMVPPLSEVWLRDRALGAAAADDPLPHLDLRTGRPPAPGLAALAVTELAADAQPLAAAMLLAGTRRGEMRLGSLRPNPSVLWLVGVGSGSPLLVEHRWSAVTRR